MDQPTSSRKRAKISEEEVDESYFKSYSHLQIHEDMIRDFARTDTYRKSVQDYKEYLKDAVVLDVGAGTGILSMFCAQAGAKKVYAIEASGIAVQAKKLVNDNKLEDIICVIQDKMENVELPEKVDIIISEWMGYFLVYESMLESVIFARDRWLKPNGIMLPGEADLHICAISDDHFFDQKIDFWKQVEKTYGVNMTSLIPFAKQCALNEVHVELLEPEHLLSFPKTILSIDCYTVTVEELRKSASEFKIEFIGDGKLAGICSWFDVHFWKNNPHIKDVKPLKLSTSPDAEATHWQQTIFYFDDQKEVRQGGSIDGKITVNTNAIHSRFIDVDIEGVITPQPETVSEGQSTTTIATAATITTATPTAAMPCTIKKQYTLKDSY